jgi:3-oxoacyl-[acyl-carrier-protein] synthase III
MLAPPKYSNVALKIGETDSDPCAVVNAAARALRKAGAPPEEIDAFMKEALSRDYNHVLNTTMAWVGFKH